MAYLIDKKQTVEKYLENFFGKYDIVFEPWEGHGATMRLVFPDKRFLALHTWAGGLVTATAYNADGSVIPNLENKL